MSNEQAKEYVHYEIYEFDNDLKKYGDDAIGCVLARTGREACENFEKENNWSSENKILFAKPPLCR